ncbi:hypothetical protein AB9H29_12180 [Stenotrophomonas sepilia]|uniref:hypothetical protein n=1 Tax=Stenotrophomonas sepilia TaxID=2860290 RepID=UPI00355821EB
MSKHTPGPWEVAHGGHGSPHGFVIDEYYVLNRTVADDVAIAADIVDPATQMPSEANARLIAAAPELLEALVNMVKWHGKREWPTSDFKVENLLPSDHQNEEVRLAMQAIAKATGEA